MASPGEMADVTFAACWGASPHPWISANVPAIRTNALIIRDSPSRHVTSRPIRAAPRGSPFLDYGKGEHFGEKIPIRRRVGRRNCGRFVSPTFPCARQMARYWARAEGREQRMLRGKPTVGQQS